MKRLLTVTSFTALLTLLRMCAGFIIAKAVAIYTGPSGMAMLGQLQSALGVLNGLVNAPTGNGVVRYTAENINEGFDSCSPWWRASIQWVVALLAVVIPVGCLLSKPLSTLLFENSEYYWIIIISCCILPFAAANTLIASVINGQQHYRRYVILGVISTTIATLVMIILIYFFKIEGALVAAAVNAGIAGFVMIIFSLRQPWFKLKYWCGKTDREYRKKIGGYVLMSMTTALTVPVSLILVRNILVSEVGWEQAGHWQAVWTISEVYLGVITMSLGTYYLPRLSSLKSVREIRSEINRTSVVIMPVVIILALGVYLFRDIAISILFTEEFRDAKSLFAIQLIGDVVKILCWLYAYPMLSRGATKWFVTTEIVFSFSLALLGLVCIKTWGVEGANIAYLTNYIFYFIVIYINLDRFAK